ncbi:MAG: TrkA C-terminal domain-containing protein, partial [Lentisphaeraceae bacterium]|nr:TrkA C-terminal domain-containing protein [Lentisphaeraceae bacterium]
KSIDDSNLKSEFGILVIGIKKKTGEVHINPESTELIHEGDILVLAGENSNIAKVQALCVG